jgi:hypothetical protein
MSHVVAQQMSGVIQIVNPSRIRYFPLEYSSHGSIHDDRHHGMCEAKGLLQPHNCEAITASLCSFV